MKKTSEIITLILVITLFGIFPGYLVIATTLNFWKMPIWYAIINLVIGILTWTTIMFLLFLNSNKNKNK